MRHSNRSPASVIDQAASPGAGSIQLTRAVVEPLEGNVRLFGDEIAFTKSIL
jgi:hypothetical protein